MTYNEIVNFLWGVADLIRDSFKRGKYADVILPLTVLRRIDAVLAPKKEAVLEANAKYQGKLDNIDDYLRSISGYAFYNTSRYDFEKLIADSTNLASNLRNYIAGFSPNMREVIDKFDFDNTISKLDDAGLLFQVLERFKNVDLHPERVSNPMMGTIFEELIRKFNEALDENPGEHFTPRDVVNLMASLLLAGDEDNLKTLGIVKTVYDPCCGSGGMLTITKDHIVGTPERAGLNPHANIHLFGQEVNPETYAVSKSDLYISSADGNDAENIAFGSTLSNDRHATMRFDYLIANPPYGKDWKRDEKAVRDDYEKGERGRFYAGLPSISDGQMLFLQHMLSKMKPVSEGGSRVAIIMNGSPLFTGDAGSGPSEIRRWILENDWLEALIALPEQLFYNTGIATYVWVLTNRKASSRRGKVTLIDATSFWTPMRRSLGDKRRLLPDERAEQVLELLRVPEDGEHVRVYPTTHFGYRKVTVERPLRLNFQASPERIARLADQKAFADLAASKKKDASEKSRDEESGRTLQSAIRAAVEGMGGELVKDRPAFSGRLAVALRSKGLRLSAPVMKAVLEALSERDETAEVCRDAKGNPEPDPELRDTENVPLSETIEAYFAREVLPHVPDALINTSVTDARDGKVGKVGYEINFNRYFYKYQPPRPLEEIEADIKAIEKEILELLAEVTR